MCECVYVCAPRLGEGMREVWHKALFVQRFWRRLVKLRAAVREILKYEVRDRDARNVKSREWMRWGIDSSRYAKLAEGKKESAITVIQVCVSVCVCVSVYCM